MRFTDIIDMALLGASYFCVYQSGKESGRRQVTDDLTKSLFNAQEEEIRNLRRMLADIKGEPRP